MLMQRISYLSSVSFQTDKHVCQTVTSAAAAMKMIRTHFSWPKWFIRQILQNAHENSISSGSNRERERVGHAFGRVC